MKYNLVSYKTGEVLKPDLEIKEGLDAMHEANKSKPVSYLKPIK